MCLGQVSGPDFEIFVDVTPGSITIDSVEATVLPNVPINTTEANGEYFTEYFHIRLNNCCNNLVVVLDKYGNNNINNKNVQKINNFCSYVIIY